MVHRFQPSRDGRRTPIYATAGGTRALRVVFDESSLSDLATHEALVLLRSMATLGCVQHWSYADLGPPADARRVYPELGGAVEGWLDVKQRLPRVRSQRVSHDVTYTEDGRTVCRSAIFGDVGRGDRLISDRTYHHLAPDDAAERRRLDSVALGAAIACKADLLVSTRPFLLKGRWFANHGTVACDPVNAVALAGQYLRSQGIFVGWSDTSNTPLTLGRGGLHWIGARALLPEGWRWFSHCVHADPESSTDLVTLAQSTFQRISRVMRRLDDLRWAMTLPPTNDAADDAVTSLDYILIDLVGAFDSAARVAHRVLDLPGSEYAAQWRGRRDWTKTLQAAAPELARHVEVNSEAGDLLLVLHLLRNTVHGAALQPVRKGGAVGQTDRLTVALPKTDAKAIYEALKRRGWWNEVGMTDFDDEWTLISPDDLALSLIRHAVRLLNTLMMLTPVERLCEMTPSVEADQRPGAFDPAIQRSILLQFGLGDALAHNRSGSAASN